MPRVIAVIYWLNIEGICPDVIFFSSQDVLTEIADEEDKDENREETATARLKSCLAFVDKADRLSKNITTLQAAYSVVDTRSLLL